jgi:polysaccharide export outer membrane protein
MRWLQLFVVLLLIPLAACATSGKVSTYPVETSGAYTLGGGDVLRVKVYGDDSVTGSYKVDEAGMIAMPLVGLVRASGRTTAEMAAAIAAALANGYVRNPDVSVEVEAYRPFFIQGAVKMGGQFTYVSGMTVRAAVSTAGGYTDTANRGRATLYRRVGAEMQERVVDLDFPIFPGDTIVIAERWL